MIEKIHTFATNNGKGMTKNEDIAEFLRHQRPKAVGFLIKRYGLSAEDAEDCFQEGSIAMWNNIREGKLTFENLTCSLSTYLIKCCCNHASHILRSHSQMTDIGSYEFRLTDEGEVAGAVNDDDDTAEREEVLRIMEEVVQHMTSPCREILWGMYYDKLSQEAIAMMLGMKGPDTVKAQKVRCMKRLKERMYTIFNAH